MFRLVLKALDWNALAEIMVLAVRGNGDYRMFKDAAEVKLQAEALDIAGGAVKSAKSV
jgi:hypothetical protein